MQKYYEVPRPSGHPFRVGSWVEIFEAYGSAEGNEAIQVRSMRVEGRIYSYPAKAARKNLGGMRPHEGRIVSVDHEPTRVRFSLALTG